MEIKVAAAYIRVSTDDQTELSPDSQIKVIKEYAKQHGFIIPKEYIFRDDGISGRRADKRPQFNMMIATAKKNPCPFSTVLLWKFSRFARNQEESIFYKSMLRKNGVDVLSVSEPMVDGPFGTLIERIIEWSDEYYSIRLSGEVKRGMTEKVERGGVVSIAPFGYSIEDKKLIVNPDTAPIIVKIYQDFLNGIGSWQIAKNLNTLGIKTTRGNVWENRTVEYILQNPVYTGKIRWNPKRRTRRNYNDPDIMIVEGQHEAIIDQKTFDCAQEKIAKTKKQYQKYKHHNTKYEYMLHGLVKCSNCGATLTMAQKSVSLQCVGYMHGKCKKSHSIALNKINDAVISTIEEAFDNETFTLTPQKSPCSDENVIDVTKLIEKEKSKLSRIKDAYANGIYTIDELKEYKNIIEAQISNLEEQKNHIKIDDTVSKSQFVKQNKKLIPLLKSKKISEKEKNEILSSFVDHIVFDRTNSAIDVFFYC